MACTPAEVMELAKCSTCVPDADAALIYALCGWANGGADPQDQGFLENSEGGLILLSDGGGIIIETGADAVGDGITTELGDYITDEDGNILVIE